jgi:hypothetical protein
MHGLFGDLSIDSCGESCDGEPKGSHYFRRYGELKGSHYFTWYGEPEGSRNFRCSADL